MYQIKRELLDSSMLPDSKIIPICRKWASILWRPNQDYDELVSVAYCNLKPRSDDSTDSSLNTWAKHTITWFLYSSYDLANLGIKIGDNKLQHNATKRNEIIANVIKNYKLISLERQQEYEDKRDILLDLEEALSNLSPDDHELIYRYFWLGQKYRDIADSMNISLTSVHKQMKRILGLIKNEVLR
jgi:RNA polymerase sigma factor (sigma-70 family)